MANMLKEFNLEEENGQWVARRPETNTVIEARKSKEVLLKYLAKTGYNVSGEPQACNDNDFVDFGNLTKLKPEFSVAKRFDMLEKTIKMVGLKIQPSAIIAGDAGMGKSHTVMEVLQTQCMLDEDDLTVIKGYVTAKGLYRQLYENQDGLIVFDDTDSILKDSTALNLLKAALDSYSKRIISWRTESFIPSDLPDSFEFKGQVIFISNLNAQKLDKALKTRSLMIDVSMTSPEKVERMRGVVEDIMPKVDLGIKLEVLDFIEEKMDYSEELSMRTLLKLVNVCITYPDDWKDMALYLMANE